MNKVIKTLTTLVTVAGLLTGAVEFGKWKQRNTIYENECKEIEDENVALRKELIDVLNDYRESLAYVASAE